MPRNLLLEVPYAKDGKDDLDRRGGKSAKHEHVSI
jgi:hypothetical protein